MGKNSVKPLLYYENLHNSNHPDRKIKIISRTFTTIKRRFEYKGAMPYNYKVIKIIESLAKEIYNLETLMKKENKENKYLPKIEFGGMYECFTKINNIDETTNKASTSSS